MEVHMKKGNMLSRIIMNTMIVSFCIIFFILVLLQASGGSRYEAKYINDEASLLYKIRNQQYDYLVEDVYQNEALGAELKGDMAKLYAAAHYYENAVLYYAHQTAGNTEWAKLRYERMKEYEGQLGEYSYVTEDIWELLEEKAGK